MNHDELRKSSRNERTRGARETLLMNAAANGKNRPVPPERGVLVDRYRIQNGRRVRERAVFYKNNFNGRDGD